jgi:pSer/pThr/pTyr-binding forkhead associated (FHA) protein
MIATLVLALRFALAIALYAFLGWALWTLWQELNHQGKKLASRRQPGITLFINAENDKQGLRQFSQAEITIGRDTNCDLSMIDEALSAHHARIIFHHGQWWLEDLHSTNGTFLNREKLTTPAVLISGDEFKCGNTDFGIRIDSADKLSPTQKL